jgi:LPS-assembly lipoprotein
MTMTRRLLLGILVAVTLGGCGFHLRSRQPLVFETIAVTPPNTGAIAIAMARLLGDAVRPLAPAAGSEGPQVVLEILQETRERTVVGVNASGQIRELLLVQRVKFRLRTAAGVELIGPTDIVQQRDFSYNETAALSKEAEEGLLYRDMQSDIVQQLMRRLAAVKTLTP